MKGRYCNADPINCHDLDGLFAVFWHRGHVNIYLTGSETWKFYKAWWSYGLSKAIPAAIGRFAPVVGLISSFVLQWVGERFIEPVVKRNIAAGNGLKLRVNYYAWNLGRVSGSWYKV